MVKNQQFFVYKFNSDFLRYKNYNVSCSSINEAKLNKWIVSLADSQALRTIRKIKYERNSDLIRYDKETLEELQKQKKHLVKHKHNAEKNKILRIVCSKIDEMLFIPEYVEIVINKKKQYEELIKHGFTINQVHYVRFCCGAGQARNNTVVFIRDDFEKEVKTRLQNGWNPNTKITANKYNAYFALSTTATYQIDDENHPELTPKVLVVPDCVTHMTKKVDWVEENLEYDPDIPIHLQNKNQINTKYKELEFNLFDGGGLIDISAARKWAEKLELDYVPSVFIIRNIYVKGCLFTVDFHKFANEVAKSNHVIDFFGKEQIVTDKDIILTESMFKIAKAYTSIEQYQECCTKFGNYWGVARVSPKEDTDWVTTNYQFIQTLDLRDDDIVRICKTTKDWLQGVCGLNREYAMLFLMGNLVKKDDPELIWNSLTDNIVKALAINPKMINDDYIKQKIVSAINKKINESYLGKLIIQGCFTTMIPDPYAMMEWVFADNDVSKVHGLLHFKSNVEEYTRDGEKVIVEEEPEAYCEYWNKRGATKVVANRSPETFTSEQVKLNLRNDEQTREWYQYLNSGVIYDVWSTACMCHADSDYDGDICCVTNDETFLRCKYYDEAHNLPITYEKKTVTKKIIKESELWKADIKSFDSKIGQITNYSTSFYDMIEKYRYDMSEHGRKCYNELLNRLKLTRKAQGDEIDRAKGVQSDPYPKHWTKRIKIKDEDSEEVIEHKNFLNELCCDRKPVFFKYRYVASKANDKMYNEMMDFYSIMNFNNKTIAELENNISAEEKARINYENHAVLIDNNSPMNKLCHYMENNLSALKKPSNTIDTTTAELLRTPMAEEINYEKIQFIKNLCDEYYEYKRRTRQGIIDNYSDIEQLSKVLREKAFDVFEDNEELANYVVEVTYIQKYHQSKSFAWGVFGEMLLENLKKNSSCPITIPIKDNSGDIKYLFNNYSLYEIHDNQEEEADSLLTNAHRQAYGFPPKTIER